MTPTEPFTLADLDEWIADVEASRRYTLHHVPNDRARENLAALLGEPVPHRLWTPEELSGRPARRAPCSCGEGDAVTADTIDIDAIHRLPDDVGANDPAVAYGDPGLAAGPTHEEM